ncbi:MAG: hypothetical protein JNK58_04385 [Phycisphaerae bacterium]|nr:hypothetical protein [Phycisphaerae bacterium]
MLTLWDLLPTKWKRRPVEAASPRRAVPTARPTKADLYAALTRDLLEEHGIKVRRWRTSMSGIAWEVRFRDGSIRRMIEAPKPKGPMSAAVFLHEVGHHAIGFNVYRPRCLEEYHAWAWAVREMESRGVEVTEAVRYRMHQSLAYAVGKARRRGLRVLPEELVPFAEPLPWRRRRK